MSAPVGATLRGMLAVMFAACALLFFGCASSPEPVVLEWQGSDEGFAMAQEAANEWFTVCHAAVWVERGNKGIPLEEIDSFPSGDVGTTERDSDGTAMWIQVSRYDDERTTLAHEMGHALGLEHARAGVMAPRSARGPGLFHVTSADCP